MNPFFKPEYNPIKKEESGGDDYTVAKKPDEKEIEDHIKWSSERIK